MFGRWAIALFESGLLEGARALDGFWIQGVVHGGLRLVWGVGGGGGVDSDREIQHFQSWAEPLPSPSQGMRPPSLFQGMQPPSLFSNRDFSATFRRGRSTALRREGTWHASSGLRPGRR